jgi:ribosome biogenesis GTPase / thiamine phosphate phosphatase
LSIHASPQLHALGWDHWFEERFALLLSGPTAEDLEQLEPARVIADFGAEYLVHGVDGSCRAAAGRNLRSNGETLPAVGDWVALLRRDPISTIHGVVERRTSFSRKVASIESREQVLAANVDIAFVVASAQDVNSRRIERYLAMSWQSGAVPYVLLTKADIAVSIDDLRTELEAVAMGTSVVVTSALTGDGVLEMNELLRPMRTGVLLGPSGVGKSTLINRMIGEEVMRTKAVHKTGEGRHMTSHRQLLQLPSGGMIIDTPGLREAQLWEGEGALANLFEDVEHIALGCRFTDCGHLSEPGCAIKSAIGAGSLDQARFDSYCKLQRELRAVAARSDARVRAEERRKWKLITMANRQRQRVRP